MMFSKAIMTFFATTVLGSGFIVAQQPPVPVAPEAPAVAQGRGFPGRGFAQRLFK